MKIANLMVWWHNASIVPYFCVMLFFADILFYLQIILTICYFTES